MGREEEAARKKWEHFEHKYAIYLQAKPDVLERLAPDEDFDAIVPDCLCRVLVAVVNERTDERRRVGRVGVILRSVDGDEYKLHCGGLTRKRVEVWYDGRRKVLKLHDVSSMMISTAEFAAWRDSMIRSGQGPHLHAGDIRGKRRQFRQVAQRKRKEEAAKPPEEKRLRIEGPLGTLGLGPAGLPQGSMNPPPPPAPLTPEHYTLIQRVRSAQKISPAFKERWARYCEENNAWARDPARHDVPFLKKMLESCADMEELRQLDSTNATEQEWTEFYGKLDDRARATFDDLSAAHREALKLDTMRGGLGNIRNPSAVLMGKIRDMERGR